MTIGRAVRLGVVAILLVLALHWVWKTNIQPGRASLFVTAVIGAVTAVYALLTYEILLENQAMAKATKESSSLMERSLRFAHSPNLLYETINVTDPNFQPTASVVPVENDDYARALATYKASGDRKEFVFAVIKNKGQGAATNLNIEAEYYIIDSSSANREATVAKQASIQVLEPGQGVALCIFISKVPTPGDQVSLRSATLTSSDFYRDAINEAPQTIRIDTKKHHIDLEAGCVVRVV